MFATTRYQGVMASISPRCLECVDDSIFNTSTCLKWVIPPQLRSNLRQPSDYIPLFQNYAEETLPSQPRVVKRIANWIESRALGLDVYGEQSRFLSQVPSCKDNCKPYGTHGPRPERLQMQTEYTKTKVLITVMTYPHPSQGYQELVCTAGVTEEGEWVRLYPIDYRYRPSNQQFHKYQWIEVDLAEWGKGNDNRKESRRPSLDTIRLLGEPLDTKNNWEAPTLDCRKTTGTHYK